MKRLINTAWLFGKLWILVCGMLVVGQVRVGGDTVLHHLDQYFDSPNVAKHFAQILYPLHWTMNKVGVNVGWDKIERTLAFQQSTEEKIKETFGQEAAEQMEKLKKAAETQKHALESIERDLSN
jgi:hypothetical protein